MLDEVVRFGTGFAAARGTSVLLSPDGRSWPAAGIPIPGARRLVPRWPLLVEFKGALYAFGARRGGMHVWRLGDDARFVELSLPQLPDPVRRVESADAVAATADGLVVLGGVRTPDFDQIGRAHV